MDDWVNDIVDMIADDMDLRMNSVVVKMDRSWDSCDNDLSIVIMNRYVF